MRSVSREVERRILTYLHGEKTRTKLGEIHAHFLRHNLHQSNQILSHFVSVCRALDKVQYAELVFEQARHPNIFLYNSMIKGYSLCGPFEKSLDLFDLMKSRGVWPDEYTLAPLFKSCSNLFDLEHGKCLHGEAIRLGYASYDSICIGVVDLYVNCASMEDAQKMFDEMPHRDIVVWNLMIKGYCKIGGIDKGLHLFRQMDDRSVVSWNSMISWLAGSGRDKEALDIFHEMQRDGFEPDEATVVTMLPLCARLGALDIGNRIHSDAQSSNLIKDFITVGNSIVNFYCKSGDTDSALRVFNQMSCKNAISWNTIISGLAFNGKGELGIDMFEDMINSGVQPDDSSFVAVLTCCSHARLVEKGQSLFTLMSETYQLQPKLEHYGCMVDLLGRVGCIHEAFDMIKTMPMKPNAALWGSLLSASRTHGDVELAECAIKELIDLEPWNSGNYVLLSNIYAEGGRWDEVQRLRMLMLMRSVKKSAGHSRVNNGSSSSIENKHLVLSSLSMILK